MKVLLLATRAATLVVILASCESNLGPTPADAEVRWRPAPGLSWQWQLSGRVDISFRVDVYDVDGRRDTGRYHGRATRWRRQGRLLRQRRLVGEVAPRRGRFLASVKVRDLDGWPGDKWLDIRRIGTLRPIMERRVDACRRKGFDAIEPDNIDGYANKSGFPLTYKDQLAYNRMLAR